MKSSQKSFSNIWTNNLDSLTSIANYLHANDWQSEKIYFSKKNYTQIISDKNKNFSYQFWKKLIIKNNHKFKSDLSYKLIMPKGLTKYAFLVSDNLYTSFRKWNKFDYELIAVGQVANSLSENQK